jgi:hypothetical protein
MITCGFVLPPQQKAERDHEKRKDAGAGAGAGARGRGAAGMSREWRVPAGSG